MSYNTGFYFSLQDREIPNQFAFYYNFNRYTGLRPPEVPPHWLPQPLSTLLILGDQSINTGIYSPGFSGRVQNYEGLGRTLEQFVSGDNIGISGGTGNFSAGYIEVADTENFNPTTLNMIVAQEKRANDPATLFSNMDEANNSGYCLGVDGANHLYFKYYNDGTPSIFTYSNIVAHEANIYRFSINSSRVSFSAFDIKEKRFVGQQSFTIQNAYNLQSNQKMLVGSGEYPYSGYMSSIFLYTGRLADYDYNALADALYKDYRLTSAISGQHSGSITGFSGVSFQDTGVLYNENLLSGYISLTGYLRSITGVTNLTGSVLTGETIYVTATGVASGTPFRGDSGYYGSGLGVSPPARFYYASGVTTASATGITGFDYLSGSLLVTGQQFPVYTGHNVTGVTATGEYLTGITGAPTYYLATGSSQELSGALPESYYPSKMIFLGQRSTGDLVEVVTYTGLDSYLLNNVVFSNQYAGPNEINNTGVLSSGSGLLVINGQLQVEGPLSFTSVSGLRSVSISGDYAVTGNSAWQSIALETDSGISVGAPDRQLASTHFLTNTLPLVGMPFNAISDVNQIGAKGKLIITDTSQYAGGPFSQINIIGTDKYFNGIKIYSGIDWINKAGGFQPTGTITGATGVYYYTTPNPGGLYSTGRAYDFSGQKINTQSNVVYINGVRQDPNLYHYGASIDLVRSGVETQIQNSALEVFNNLS